tara:strand:- start:4045 stop:5289 length:1245 start_codon:yes stop_codon:yes gene_type:complete
MSFDFNIDNYTKTELMDIFDLPTDYDQNIFEIQATKMRDNLVHNKELKPNILTNTLAFITKCKHILFNEEITSTGTNFLENVYNSNYTLKPVPLEDPNDHMVQVRENTPYLSSYPSQFFPGVINPLKKNTRYINLNIDSKFRDNYLTTSAANFNVKINQNMNNILTMRLDVIELPTTFYSISSKLLNNYFYIDLPETDESQLIEIIEGNYDYKSLEYTINNQLQTIGGNFEYIVFNIDSNESLGGSTWKMMVQLTTTSGAPITYINLNFKKDRSGIEDNSVLLQLKLGWIMGFRQPIYINKSSYISEGIVDVLGIRYLYLAIDDFNTSVNNSFYSVFNNSLLNKNILSRITLHGNTFNTDQVSDLYITRTPREYFGPVNIQNFNVQLLDPYGRIVDLNHMDFSFCLTLQTAYDI